MAIQIPNLGSGNGLTGDNELVIRQKYNANFTDQTNAASRLVGKDAGNVLQVGAFGVGANYVGALGASGRFTGANGFFSWSDDTGAHINTNGTGYMFGINIAWADGDEFQIGRSLSNPTVLSWRNTTTKSWHALYSTGNTIKDANGFLKGASPVVDLYDSVMEQNEDAKKQDITFEKVATGDYLIKGSLGFAQEGWYIEMPKDANGNVLVAVVYRQLPNNDISVKTYAKRFDEDTGDIVANLTKPRDIPAGRFISLRLHELPTEPTPPME